jgi:hypothetical protein
VTAHRVRRQSAEPIRVPAGNPSAMEMLSPPITVASARPCRSGGVMAAAVLNAAAPIRPAPSAVNTRDPSTTGYVGPSAVSALPTENPARPISIVVRRSSPLVAAPSTGADTANARANAVTSWPAAGMSTPRSWAIAGSRPAMTKPSVPTAKRASESGSSRTNDEERTKVPFRSDWVEWVRAVRGRIGRPGRRRTRSGGRRVAGGPARRHGHRPAARR